MLLVVACALCTGVYRACRRAGFRQTAAAPAVAVVVAAAAVVAAASAAVAAAAVAAVPVHAAIELTHARLLHAFLDVRTKRHVDCST